MLYVEHFAIFDALRQININEKYVNILENIYQNAKAKVHIDNMESELFPIKRGVRQGDPISPKLFTAAIEMIFRKAELKHGLNIDGETLTNLRFADDVALITENTKSMEEQLNNLNKISLESGLKMHKVALFYPVAGLDTDRARTNDCGLGYRWCCVLTCSLASGMMSQLCGRCQTVFWLVAL
ncbi:endonuclease-reverse transcriptase [Elysia marginata]|uniref:Endonuclease-reverse transcriptase n=1 Tax=Elysia marginata TaxID=1093978 RepID=A0AAV4I3S7_9GAST|nr:endonuclease-reverse transcriptase [Elysia marginata]